MCTNSCSLVYTDAWFNFHTCGISQTQARMCTLALKNPILTILTPFSLILSSNRNFNALFSSFCKSCPPSQVRAAPTVLLHGIGSWPRKQGATYALQALSLSSVCCRRPLPVPFWCGPWSRGGGILFTISILLIGRWRWLLMTFIGWLALGVMGRSLTWGCVEHTAGHKVAWEEVLNGYDPLLRHWDGLQAFLAGDSWWLCLDG